MKSVCDHTKGPSPGVMYTPLLRIKSENTGGDEQELLLLQATVVPHTSDTVTSAR